MNNIVYIAKTDINTDGRILNQLKILKEWKKDLVVDLIVFPDKKVTVSFADTVNLHQINTNLRHNKMLRVFTVLEFTLKALRLLHQLKPSILHAQDSSIILPVLLYRVFHRKSCFIIYDDHEVPNENVSYSKKIMVVLENFLLKNADAVIMANKERMLYLRKKINLKNKLLYFLNLPYFDVASSTLPSALIESKLYELDSKINRGTKFIIHQGPLKIERGRQKLADFSKNLPNPYVIMLLGGTEADFIKFMKENALLENKFHFIGTVKYEVLPLFWKKGWASIVMYLPTYINNRLCAPNRLYLSYFLGLPSIVNRENPVLSDFVDSHNSGLYIEDFIDYPRVDFFDQLNSLVIDDAAKENLLAKEKNKLVELYSGIIYKS